eukprot:tig00020912_g15824.t1
MSKGGAAVTVKDALKNWADKTGKNPAEEEHIPLWGQIPPIEKMDTSVNTLKKCKKLSLSTNCIDKIGSLAGMDNLEILSLSRNSIKKIENLDGVADTLQELWLSYNAIEKLTGIEKLSNLRVLYLAYNKIAGWAEFDRLMDLKKLKELIFIGNPLYDKVTKDESEPAWRIQCIKKLPQLTRLDGQLVLDEEKEAAGVATS